MDKIYFKKQQIVDNTQLDSSPNLKCMLIATGPSVHKLEKSNLQQPNIDYIGVNGAIALNDVKFKYYVIIDHNFTNNRFDLVTKVLSNSSCTLFTTPRCLDLILRKIQLKKIVRLLAFKLNFIQQLFLHIKMTFWKCLKKPKEIMQISPKF